MQGRTQAVLSPPLHVWEGLAQYAPEAAELACHSLDIASAESYFVRVRAFSDLRSYPSVFCICVAVKFPSLTLHFQVSGEVAMPERTAADLCVPCCSLALTCERCSKGERRERLGSR